MTDPLLRSSDDCEILAGAPVGQAGRNRTATWLKILAAVLLLATVAAALIGYRQSQKQRRESLRYQAQAAIQRTEAGSRFQALDALERAARIRPGTDLRNEYLRCLDVPGLRPLAAIPGEDATNPFALFMGHFAFRGEDRIVGILGAHPAANIGTTSSPAIFSSSAESRTR